MPSTRTVIRFTLTALVFLAAAGSAYALWNHYMYSPWTRDGRVQAKVIQLAADVSGIVQAVPVVDNQLVRKGDLVLVIDPDRYQLALQQAEASVAARKAERDMYAQEIERRSRPGGEVVSKETQDNVRSLAQAAQALYDEALSHRATAQLNLDRTQVRAPVDGYITNLAVYPGDYVTVGMPKMAIIDKDSFWITGYFEETKVPFLKVGDPVDIFMMNGSERFQGRIESIARGIGDRENPTGHNLLVDVNPSYHWVRLAQRIPVRIRLENLPADAHLSVGMTSTVVVRPQDRE